ncbi:MarR family winged helix-turn-helix transcriptional regulator [Nocardioides bruguierae]|uniref:MarR family winged helix-turn-helix transcriptional regulator n=1 Tax=Nocardioides bruguierae TaxID=2945102 RepID=UPI0020217A94|nr:MarR family transcriptional regulator [Nocardioides bruguierae]MCL8026158.1 MarR family transcriptional regulator [Nocardioides bruguierae]
MTRPDPIREARRQWVARGWSDAADGMAMVTTLVRAQQLLMERIEAVLRPHGLTFARYELLQLLSFTRDGRLPMTRLGSLLQVHPASVTSAVDRLERQGLVLRERGETDRRVVLAVLTDAGRALAAAATEDLNDVFRSTGIAPGEVTALTDLLTRLRRSAGDPVD